MRSRKFWFWLLAVAAVWGLLYAVLRPFHAISTYDLDTAIVFAIGTSALSAAAGMAAVRRQWSYRALGIFGTFLGIGWFYFVIGCTRVGWREAFGVAELYGIRAILLVSLALFHVGFWGWVIAYRAARHDEAMRNYLLSNGTEGRT